MKPITIELTLEQETAMVAQRDLEHIGKGAEPPPELDAFAVDYFQRHLAGLVESHQAATKQEQLRIINAKLEAVKDVSSEKLAAIVAEIEK
jgi:hypothetical protein